MITLICLIVAVVCFVLVCHRVNSPAIDFWPLGWAFCVVAVIAHFYGR